MAPQRRWSKNLGFFFPFGHSPLKRLGYNTPDKMSTILGSTVSELNQRHCLSSKVEIRYTKSTSTGLERRLNLPWILEAPFYSLFGLYYFNPCMKS